MPPFQGVVKHLIIINVIVYVIVHVLLQNQPNIGAEYFVLYNFDSPYFKPIQLITSMFNHASPQHLLFNMLTLYFLGPMVESFLGTQKFFILYFLSGLAASVIFFMMTDSNGGLLGASGAISGVAGAFATMFPNIPLYLMFIPIPIKAKYLVWGGIVLGLLASLSGRGGNIANEAHFGGAIMGLLLVLYWHKNNLR